jgi:hypothetical protein
VDFLAVNPRPAGGMPIDHSWPLAEWGGSQALFNPEKKFT